MILSCCFGNNKQKRKEEAGQTSLHLQEYDDEPLRQKHCVSASGTSGSGSSTSVRRNSNDPSVRGKYHQEKYPPSKKEKRILKQRSQDSLSSSLIRAQASSPGGRPAQPRCQSELLPSPPETPRVEGRPQRGSRPQSTTETGPGDCGGNVEISRSEVSVCHEREGKETLAMVEEPNHHSEVTNVQSSLEHSENREFQYQVDKDQVRLKELEIEQLKEDHNLLIEKLKEEQRLAADQARQFYAEKLEREVAASRTETQLTVMKITNEANESISRLTEQLEAEKTKILEEQQRTVEGLRRDLGEREEKLSEAFQGISEREDAWREEKAEVVLEVQRLKAEASKMVSLLALEYEEENLTEEKKRSLSAEVYSLQLVVDMRTGEVRNLRDQLATLTHHLEIMHDVQTKLAKANNRIEDLEEQLKLKVQSEQLLWAQRDQLETTVSHSSREVERMSQNVEELQWRIRNNYELPVEICSPTSQRPTQLRFDRLTSSEMDEIPRSPRQSQQDNLSQVQSNEESGTEETKNSLFSVSKEMLEATSPEETVAQESPVATSDYSSSNSTNSPHSDLYLEQDLKLPEDKEQVEESDGNNNIHQEEGNIDSDSLDDEGLGDISSEGENADSPLPTEPSDPSLPSVPSLPTKCLGEIVNTSCEPPAGAKTSTKSEELSTKLYQDTEKERRPSRISFETPL